MTVLGYIVGGILVLVGVIAFIGPTGESYETFGMISFVGGWMLLVVSDVGRRLRRTADAIDELLGTLRGEVTECTELETSDADMPIYDDWGGNDDISARQRLRDSGLFSERPPQGNGTVCFRLRGAANGASIYALMNDREVHIRDSAFRNNRFPNSERLYDLVQDHAHGTVHGEGNSAYAFRLSSRHIDRVIEIIRVGL